MKNSVLKQINVAGQIETAQMNANLGMDAVLELRGLFAVVKRLAEISGDENILRIAGIGIRLADMSHNMLDCEREGIA